MDGVQELIDGWVSQQHLDIAAATPHRGWSVVILAAIGSRRRRHHFDDSNVCVVVAAAGY